jgi:hypothetical protein
LEVFADPRRHVMGVPSLNHVARIATGLAFGLCLMSITRADEPPAKTGIPPAKSAGEFAGFTFLKDRPDDEFLDFPMEAPAGLVGKRLQVRVTESGGRTWLLPVYVVQDVRLPAAGGTTATVVLADALYHPEFERAVSAAMKVKFGNNWSKAVPVDNRVAATLRVTVGDEEAPLATVRFKREAAKKQLTLTFPLDSAAAKRLATAPRESIGLTFEETYRGRFTDAEVVATATVTSTAATNFVNNLRPDARGQTATLLVSIGGGVDQQVSVRSAFARQVGVEVWTKEGTSPNPTLVDNLVTKLFAGITEEKSLGDKPNEQVVTFLTANGLKATASLGTFRELKDQWKKERESGTKSADSGSEKDRTKRSGEAEASGFQVFSAKVKFEAEDERERTWVTSRENQARALDEVMKGISGELPLAVLSADQVQKIASRADSVQTVTTGSFRDGRKAMRHPQSLAEAFEVVEARAAPKSEAEKRRDALAKTTADLDAARKAAAAALTARDAVSADNKPHEDRLPGLQRQAAGAKAAAAAESQAIDAYVAGRPREVKLPGAVITYDPDKDQALQARRRALAGQQQAAAALEAEAAALEKNLVSMRAKLAAAEKAVADAKSEVVRLEAKKAALEQLAREDR